MFVTTAGFHWPTFRSDSSVFDSCVAISAVVVGTSGSSTYVVPELRRVRYRIASHVFGLNN